MANSHVELDFFGLHNLTNSMASQPLPQPRLDRRQSFRGISKINPEIVKSVIASASKNGAPENGSKSSSLPVTPRFGVSQLPIFQPHPFSGQRSMEKAEDTPPMTIFYNGTVSVFDLPKDKAEYILKYAMEKNIAGNDEQVMDDACFKSQNSDNMDILGQLNDGEMPLKRKKSLQRFFEKRKERLISVSSPYSSMDHVASFHHQKTQC